MCLFEGENNSKSSIIASQYLLLSKHPNIAFIYDCQIEGEIFNPRGIVDINRRHSQNMAIYHDTFLNPQKTIMNEMCLLYLIRKYFTFRVSKDWKCIPN